MRITIGKSEFDALADGDLGAACFAPVVPLVRAKPDSAKEAVYRGLTEEQRALFMYHRRRTVRRVLRLRPSASAGRSGRIRRRPPTGHVFGTREGVEDELARRFERSLEGKLPFSYGRNYGRGRQ